MKTTNIWDSPGGHLGYLGTQIGVYVLCLWVLLNLLHCAEVPSPNTKLPSSADAWYQGWENCPSAKLGVLKSPSRGLSLFYPKACVCGAN